jgi:hypothetical protein
MRKLAALAFVLGLLASTMGAGATAASAASAPFLRHTGDAYLNRPVVASFASPDTAAPSSKGLNIVPTFDISITGDPNAATIESSIRSAISGLESRVGTHITVHIAYASVSNGLGGAATYYNNVPYSKYRSDLQRLGTSTYDKQALNNLPAGSNNPVNGSTGLVMTLPLLRAIGATALCDYGNHVDSTIMLNTGIMNLSRTGPQDPAKYDLQQVVTHEMVEVLGAGGAGSSLLSNQVGPLDLDRYSAPGVRSYTTDSSAVSYLSVNAGKSNLGYFNQNSGGDYGDWYADLNGHPQVQDAFSTPEVQLNLVKNELIAIDVIGYVVVL